MSRTDVGGGDDARERLVVAGQALELEHLQNLIRTRDRDAAAAAAATKRLLEEAGRQNGLLKERNAQLQEQVQLLADKLRVATAAASRTEGNVTDDPSSWRRAANASGARDALLEEMRKEVAAGRQQIASLLEEREILLEKLVSERSHSALLAIQAAAAGATPADTTPGETRSLRHRVEKAVQTTDLGDVVPPAAPSDEQVPPPANKEMIDDLRQRIDLEQSLERYFLETVEVHRANAALLRDQLQRCLRRHMATLERERSESDKLMRQYSSSATSASDTAAATYDEASTARSPADAGASSSRVLGVVASPAKGQPTSTSTSAVASPYYAQQEREMMHLRKRLMELQARHEATNSGDVHSAAAAVHREQEEVQPSYLKLASASSSPFPSGAAARRSTLSAVAGRSDVLSRMLSSASKGSTRF